MGPRAGFDPRLGHPARIRPGLGRHRLIAVESGPQSDPDFGGTEPHTSRAESEFARSPLRRIWLARSWSSARAWRASGRREPAELLSRAPARAHAGGGGGSGGRVRRSLGRSVVRSGGWRAVGRPVGGSVGRPALGTSKVGFALAPLRQMHQFCFHSHIFAMLIQLCPYRRRSSVELGQTRRLRPKMP